MDFEIKDSNELRYMWDHDGVLPEDPGQRIELHDVLATSNASIFFPQVVENIIKEAAEPYLIGTSLLNRINYKAGQQITFPAVGALDAADIAEGEEYPERTIQMGGGTVTAKVGKSGLAVKLTEEMIRYSQWDIIGLHIRAAGRAMARHKEKKIFSMIQAFGFTVFDNANPENSAFGVTHGRNMQGQPNGSVVIDDIFDAYAQVLTQGYTPNTLLMHPLTWVMFVKDPVLRAFALANGGGVFFAAWKGNPSGRAPWDNSSQGSQGFSPGQKITPATTPNGTAAPHGETGSSTLAYPQTLTSAPQLPAYANLPLMIIVSPFVPFDARSRLTDIYMFDRNELGALIVDEELTTGEWDDPARDIKKIKVRERYALAIFAEGMSIGKISNVKVVPNEIVLPAQATIQTSSTIQAIDPSVAVV
jgi:hypothetical protein